MHASAALHVTIIGIFSLMDYSISHPTENTLKLNQSHCIPTLLYFAIIQYGKIPPRISYVPLAERKHLPASVSR